MFPVGHLEFGCNRDPFQLDTWSSGATEFVIFRLDTWSLGATVIFSSWTLGVRVQLRFSGWTLGVRVQP